MFDREKYIEEHWREYLTHLSVKKAINEFIVVQSNLYDLCFSKNGQRKTLSRNCEATKLKFEDQLATRKTSIENLIKDIEHKENEQKKTKKDIEFREAEISLAMETIKLTRGQVRVAVVGVLATIVIAITTVFQFKAAPTKDQVKFLTERYVKFAEKDGERKDHVQRLETQVKVLTDEVKRSRSDYKFLEKKLELLRKKFGTSKKK